jgi:adenylate cyclase
MKSMDERAELARRLRRAGYTKAEVDAVVESERAPALVVETALGGPPRHTLSHVARESGLRPDRLRELLRALGRPDPTRGERMFTDEDIEQARIAKRLLDAGLPRRDLLAVARTLNQGLTPVAEGIRQMVGNAFISPGQSRAKLGLRYADVVEGLGSDMSALLSGELRALLRERIQTDLITDEEAAAGELGDTQDVAVAFADLVDFTALGGRIPPTELSEIAARLAEVAAQCAARPVRLVKTVGDAAMLVSSEPDALVRCVLEILRELDGEDGDFPAIHAGVDFGPATNRAGDWFGPPVNLASRITDVAKPGRILLTEDVAQRLDGGIELKRKRRRSLAGVDGRVRLFELAPDANA